MTTYFRTATVALTQAQAAPTPDNIAYAIDRCRMEWARGGSAASVHMLRAAEALAAKLEG